MSRWEFMRQLEELLSDISPSEREEALQYYNDYFNDAGKENEWEVINALGSPSQVAQIVKDGLGSGDGGGEFTENGFENAGSMKENAVMKRPEQTQDGAGASAGSQGSDDQIVDGEAKQGDEKKDLPTWAIILIVVGCVFLSPVLLGLAGAAVGVIISIFASVLALVFGFGATSIVLFIVAIALVVAGFASLLVHPINTLGLFGAACICAAIGILLMLLTVFLVGKCIPGICQGIGYIFGKLFGKKEGNA